MKTHTIRPKEILVMAAMILGVVIALPLLGVSLFVLRFILMAAAVVALLGGVILFALSRRFRRRFLAVLEPSYDYKGLQLSTDVALDTAHSWARVEPDGAFVGVDDLAARCVGPVERVELPAVGQRARRGEPLFTLVREGRSLEAPSPVTGIVIARNEALCSDPQRVNRDPYGLGWTARIRTDDARASRHRLMRGLHAQDWFRDEVDRLVATLASGPSVAPTLADGGAVVDELHRAIDEPDWWRLQRQFFAGDRERKPGDPADLARE